MCGEISNGAYKVFGKRDSKMVDILDKTITKFNGYELFIPAIIEKKHLEKRGYFKKIPQNIT